MDNYRKNFILCDSVVYYCLLCDESLTEITNVEKHIRWEKHRKSLKNQSYCPRFRKDFIYKVENHFYCEVCNFVISDVDSAIDHINNDEHKAMKTKPITKTKIIGQYDSGSIVINQLKLSMAEWNSIIDNKCFICNADVPNIKLHMASKEHVILLIKSVFICENEHYYRKINNDKYHCFSCKKVYSPLELNYHWPSCKNNDENNLQDYVLVDRTEKSAMSNETEQETNPNQVEGSGTNGFSEEKITAKEYCNDYGKLRHELKKYGMQHSIKLIQSGRKGWCTLCDRFLGLSKISFEDHVNGAIHQGHLELQGLISPTKKHIINILKKESILQCNPHYSSDNCQLYVLDNWKIDLLSFLLVYRVEDKNTNKTKCFACNELFPQGQESEHCSTPKHQKNFLAAEVVMTFVEKGHFIREIRKNYFHCGLCNQTIPFFEKVLLHFKTSTHKAKMVGRTGSGSELITFNTYTADSVFIMDLISSSFRDIIPH